MDEISLRIALLLSAQRALLGAVHPQLRQASIEANSNENEVRVRFEYDGSPTEETKESCSCAATEIAADLTEGWCFVEEHVSVPTPSKLAPLQYVAYQRWEPSLGA